ERAELAIVPWGARVARPEEWGRPGREDRRYGDLFRGAGDPRRVDLLGPPVVRLPARLPLRPQGRRGGQGDEAEQRAPDHGLKGSHWARAIAPATSADRLRTRASGADSCHRAGGPRRADRSAAAPGYGRAGRGPRDRLRAPPPPLVVAGSAAASRRTR